MPWEEPRSIKGTRGASSKDAWGLSAHCMAQMASGRMYARDLKWPSVVHASGVWKEYLLQYRKYFKLHNKSHPLLTEIFLPEDSTQI
jgi:hypothetical protein